MESDQWWQQYATRYQVEAIPFLPPTGHDPKLVICIPAYAEKNIIETLRALDACNKPPVDPEVIIFGNIDSRASADEVLEHERMILAIREWIEFKATHLHVHLIPYVAEDRKWGVGLARKKLLDEAARRAHPQSILVCLDADCLVDDNYLTAIFDYFDRHPDIDAASIYFEHDYTTATDAYHQQAIISYELHLRYLVQAKRWTGHPFSFHTVGSAMAVRRNAYLLQGGMNTRQAGEDFYFLHKFIETGRFGEIQETRVMPSVRVSARVPFGTGRAMMQMVEDKQTWDTISFDNMEIIRQWIASLDALFIFLDSHADSEVVDHDIISFAPASLHDFLEGQEYGSKCRSIYQHTSGRQAFRNRWFRVFGIFQLIRATHYLRDSAFPNTSVTDAANALASEMGWSQARMDERNLLELFRQKDRQQS